MRVHWYVSTTFSYIILQFVAENQIMLFMYWINSRGSVPINNWMCEGFRISTLKENCEKYSISFEILFFLLYHIKCLCDKHFEQNIDIANTFVLMCIISPYICWIQANNRNESK